MSVLAASLALPLPVWSAALSLGTARGIRGVDLSLDGGKSWLALGGHALPVMDGTVVRTTTGGALLDLTDGSRLNLLPFTTVRVRESDGTTEITLVQGRLTFRLPAQTRVEVRTAGARLEPVRAQAMAGEVFADNGDAMGLKMTQGTFRVQEIAGAQRVLLASLQPVFLPKRPATRGAIFTVDAPPAPPADVRSAFTPKGESIGYVGRDAQLVVYPGFTADLTQPFPPRLVRTAMAQIPEKDRQDATPVFDVNGGYLGYLSGPVFYAQAQVAQAVEGGGAGGGVGLSTGAMVGIGALVVIGAGVGIAAAVGAFNGEGGKKEATSVSP